MDGFLDRVEDSGCDGLLLHGVPPRARPGYYASAWQAGLPIVTTCFVSSSPAIMREAAENASAYLYLVSSFGTGEGSGAPDPARLAPALDVLRGMTDAPIAVGFGVSTGADVRAVWEAGADAGIVGSACVASLERTLMAGCDPLAGMRRFLDGVHPAPVHAAPAVL
jgi:tryptophan synthase alpha chain